MDDQLPEIPPRLVEALERRFPVVNPRPTDTHSHIMYVAGQRSVVELLRRALNERAREEF